MKFDRDAFLAKLGGAAAVAALSHQQRAEALEAEMVRLLEEQDAVSRSSPRQLAENPSRSKPVPKADSSLPAMPEAPTLMDFFERRFSTAHVLRSAQHALATGQPERTVFACLVHDVGHVLWSDHGWWGSRLFEPYVDARISWAIRYHQTLLFYPDDSVNYDYPRIYSRVFGEDYVPDGHTEEAYRYVRGHKWYMEARLVTLGDQRGFVPDLDVELEDFTDIIGRNFRQPKEGLGQGDSLSAHMWRAIINAGVLD